MKYLILPFLLLLNASCIGAGGLGSVDYTSRKQKGPQESYKMLKSDLTIAESRMPFRLSDIESDWGVPDKISTEGNQQIVSYRNGLRWHGMVLLCILPVPFALPVGYATTNFYFEDDKLTYWTIQENHYCITYAGLNLIPFSKNFGFVADISCDWHKGMPNNGRMVCDLPVYDHCYPEFFNH